MNANEERLRRLIAEVFEVDESTVDESATSETIPSWDSLNTLKLIMTTESEFDVRYPEEEMARATNWKAIVESLRRAGVQI